MGAQSLVCADEEADSDDNVVQRQDSQQSGTCCCCCREVCLVHPRDRRTALVPSAHRVLTKFTVSNEVALSVETLSI